MKLYVLASSISTYTTEYVLCFVKLMLSGKQQMLIGLHAQSTGIVLKANKKGLGWKDNRDRSEL